MKIRAFLKNIKRSGGSLGGLKNPPRKKEHLQAR